MYDLNALLDAVSTGWVIGGAWSMNDAGRIVGVGIDPASGQTHAVLLTPVTELLITQCSLTATNTLALGWPAVLGAQYQMESADHLGSPEWHDVGGPITAQATNATLVLPFDISNNAQFYRVRQVVSP
jgi:hypothetical protein